MKKGFMRKVCSLLAIGLVMAILLMSGGMLASAATTSPEETRIPVPSGPAMPAPPLNRSYYWVQVSQPYYSPVYCTAVADFQLSDAAKLARVRNLIYPADQLDEEIQRIERFNRVETLKERIYSGQTRPIWDYLSTTTRNRVAQMDAEHALKYIRRTTEYQKDATLRRFVDSYLNETLSASQLRWALRAILPAYTEAIDAWSVRSLLWFAKCTARTPAYAKLREAMEPLRYHNAGDAASLSTSMDAEEIALHCEALITAVRAYLPNEVQAIENLRYTLPIDPPKSPEQSETPKHYD